MISLGITNKETAGDKVTYFRPVEDKRDTKHVFLAIMDIVIAYGKLLHSDQSIEKLIEQSW